MTNSRIFSNAKWIVGCKIVQSLTQLVIGMLSARYLGPSNYGLISYAGSIVAFAVPVMQLGLRSTLVQEYVEHPEKEGETLGTALVMNLLSAMASMVGVIAFSMVADHGRPETIAVCALYSVSLLFQAVEMIQYWFQSKLMSRYPSLAMLGAYFVVSAYKIWLLATRKSVRWFALSHSIEYCLVGLMLFMLYRRLGSQKITVSRERAKRMFARSKYYIVSSLMVTIFQNTDHVMLKLMVGEAENGFYTTAITCSAIAVFVYSAIIDSYRPVILEEKKRSEEAFRRGMSNLYCIVTYLALTQSICFTLFANPIVRILYGETYLQAIPVLRILVWYTAFSYMGTIRNIWILAEGKQNVLWIINLSGVAINVVLNALMIPYYGACGAALASVITQFFTNFIIGFLLAPIRPNNKLLLEGLRPRTVLGLLKSIKKENFRK